LIAAVLVLVAGPSSLSASAGAQEQGQGHSVPGKIPGDEAKNKIKDNRTGRVAPTTRQREAAAAVHARARWNGFGTPAVLASSGSPLARGLAADPVTAARAYIATNRDLLGLTESGAAALEVVTVAPIGKGSAVLLRQRFGDQRQRWMG